VSGCSFLGASLHFSSSDSGESKDVMLVLCEGQPRENSAVVRVETPIESPS